MLACLVACLPGAARASSASRADSAATADSSARAAVGAPAPLDTAGIIRPDLKNLPGARPRPPRAILHAGDSLGVPAEGPSAPPAGTSAPRAAGTGGGRAAGAYLYSALDSAVTFPILEAGGPPDPRFGPSPASDSTPSAAIAYPRPRPALVMLRSTLVPGWGQLTNGKWLKAILAAGLEGYLFSQALRAGRDIKAGRDTLCAGVPGSACDSLETALQYTGDPLALRIQDSRDRRTAYYWWTAGAIGVSMLDAYVDAHFHGFDVRPVALVDPAARRAWLGITWSPGGHFP